MQRALSLKYISKISMSPSSHLVFVPAGHQVCVAAGDAVLLRLRRLHDHGHAQQLLAVQSKGLKTEGFNKIWLIPHKY